LEKRDWNVKSFLKKSALRSASCLQALSITGLAVGAIAISAPAAAQDYTAGAVSGTVTDANGAPVAGASVTLSSNDTGGSRTSTSTSTGAFRFSSLTPGNYTLKVTSPGAPDFTATDVRVVASQTAALNVALATGGSQEIVVTAAQIQQPFSGTTSGVTVDLEDLVTKVPVGRDISNVMLLAPGTSRGESIFGGKSANFVSIGGSSVAENAYYINGLNITNFDNYLGGAEVPFDFYKSVEIKSGGYSAEFGRATGGIVNAVSKSGSNDFDAALHLNWAPDFLRSDNKNLLTCGYDDASNTTFTCEPYTNRKYDKNDSYSAIAELSGPIIKDRLFVYGLFEMRHAQTLTIARSSEIAVKRESNDPFWAVKVDAYPLDDHHFEFTIFDTRNAETQSNLAYSEDANGKAIIGPSLVTFNNNTGGVNFVGKYTGHFTDWLTLSAAYGRMRDRFNLTPVDFNAGTFYGNNSSGADLNGTPNGGLTTGQTESIIDNPYKTQRKFWRADADLFFTAFGDHHIRMGYDQENNTLNHVAYTPGEGLQCDVGYITTAACTEGSAVGAGVRFIFLPALTAKTQAATGANPLLIGQPIVQLEYYNSGGLYKAQNRAFYIQDEWDVTDRLTLNLGVRRDDFKLDKADGTNLVDLDKNYAPRLGATYEMWADHSGKIRAFYGWYYLPVASNSSFRQASPELYFRERWGYNGFDSNGLPILTQQYNPQPGTSSYAGTCPFQLTPGSALNFCSVTGDGTVPDTSAAIAHNLKATRESEWILGYEHKLNDWTVGLTYTHRNLDRSAEDMAIDRAVLNYCDDNGLTGCSSTWSGFNQYVIANPGSDIVVNLRGQDARLVTFTKEELAAIGFPKAKRTYDAVEFTFEHPWNGKWSFEGSYTWSSSKGNSEGFVQSDFQQDDSGITQDFDQPGFLDGAYGYLPNHRRHRLKMYGAYAITDAFILGSNVSLESPRHLSCFGYHPGSAVTDGFFENQYDQASHYCGGVLSPRGTAQKSQWVSQIDLSGRYNLEIPTGQMVTFRFDVFNILNSHAIEDRDEIGDLDETGLLDPSYHQARLYQAPRSVRLGIDVNF
jgi:outer membrane receptor protein involved in Fe transport